MTDDATRADKIDVDRERGVTIVFGDGRSCYFPNDELRAACPCAECRGLRDQGIDVWPRPGGPASARIEGAELVGLWGIGIAWNDGHATGIYPWSSLREWGGTEAAPTP
ncbi:MAG TPA: DUF971 domain-containing protein [Acidimicrobiales bacterium]